VRHRHIVAVHQVGVKCFGLGGPGFVVNHELVAVQVEIGPVDVAAAFAATKYLAVKFPGGLYVVDRNGYVEGG